VVVDCGRWLWSLVVVVDCCGRWLLWSLIVVVVDCCGRWLLWSLIDCGRRLIVVVGCGRWLWSLIVVVVDCCGRWLLWSLIDCGRWLIVVVDCGCWLWSLTDVVVDCCGRWLLWSLIDCGRWLSWSLIVVVVDCGRWLWSLIVVVVDCGRWWWSLIVVVECCGRWLIVVVDCGRWWWSLIVVVDCGCWLWSLTVVLDCGCGRWLWSLIVADKARQDRPLCWRGTFCCWEELAVEVSGLRHCRQLPGTALLLLLLLLIIINDTLLYLGLSTLSLQTATSCLERCLSSLHAWFCCNGMCLNPMKSEATLLGSSRCLQSFPVIRDVSIISSVLPTTDKVTTLGVILDSKLTFDAHMSAICKNAHFYLRALRHIRSSLITDMATSIAVTLVQSRLDYANSLLYRVSTRKISINSNAARTPLPIQARIDFKIVNLVELWMLATGNFLYFSVC